MYQLLLLRLRAALCAQRVPLVKHIIQRLANESGIDPAQFNIDPQSIASIRSALTNASDEDLQQVAEQYEANKRKRR